MGVTGINPKLTTITAGGQKWTVAAEAAPALKGFLDELAARGVKVGGSGSGGYNDRWVNIKGKPIVGKPSNHARGTAIDVNPSANAQGQRGTSLPKDIRSIAAKWGLKWGMDFPTPDPMHFEYVGKTAKTPTGGASTSIRAQLGNTTDTAPKRQTAQQPPLAMAPPQPPARAGVPSADPSTLLRALSASQGASPPSLASYAMPDYSSLLATPQPIQQSWVNPADYYRPEPSIAPMDPQALGAQARSFALGNQQPIDHYGALYDDVKARMDQLVREQYAIFDREAAAASQQADVMGSGITSALADLDQKYGGTFSQLTQAALAGAKAGIPGKVAGKQAAATAAAHDDLRKFLSQAALNYQTARNQQSLDFPGQVDAALGRISGIEGQNRQNVLDAYRVDSDNLRAQLGAQIDIGKADQAAALQAQQLGAQGQQSLVSGALQDRRTQFAADADASATAQSTQQRIAELLFGEQSKVAADQRASAQADVEMQARAQQAAKDAEARLALEERQSANDIALKKTTPASSDAATARAQMEALRLPGQLASSDAATKLAEARTKALGATKDSFTPQDKENITASFAEFQPIYDPKEWSAKVADLQKRAYGSKKGVPTVDGAAVEEWTKHVALQSVAAKNPLSPQQRAALANQMAQAQVAVQPAAKKMTTSQRLSAIGAAAKAHLDAINRYILNEEAVLAGLDRGKLTRRTPTAVSGGKKTGPIGPTTR